MTEYEELEKSLAAIIGEDPDQVPGLGAILYKNGQPVYSFCGGRAYIGGKSDGEADRPFLRDSLFRIASVSKQFTVYTIMQLAEQGRLSLSDDVSRYLGFSLRHPDFPYVPITIEMLCCHTSGLRDGIIYCIPPEFGVREFFFPDGKFYEEGAHFATSDEPPGEYFSYCNLNYGLLGTIIETVTGERFDTYQQEHILAMLDIDGGYLPANLQQDEFHRLGGIYQKQQAGADWQPMMDCYDGRQPARDTVTMQNPYAEQDDSREYSLTGYVPGTNATFFAPQGGLRLSLKGMSHALEMLMGCGLYRGKRVLSRDSVEQMTAKHWIYQVGGRDNGDTEDGVFLSYGLGLYQIDGGSRARVCRDIDIDLVGHTGEAFGLLSGLFFRPDTGDGFVYIMNGEGLPEDAPESRGRFSGNFVWEERIMDALCRAFMK
ncbi:MAG: serine hydrolase domain-containing protein [Selenomonadaceae bacterium]|nr:serine hydrolase domain-containing protein [Selenomonadaceae bacterium]